MHLCGGKWWERQAPVPTHVELSDTPSAAYLQRKLEAQQYKLNVEKQLVSDVPLRSWELPICSLLRAVGGSVSQVESALKSQMTLYTRI